MLRRLDIRDHCRDVLHCRVECVGWDEGSEEDQEGVDEEEGSVGERGKGLIDWSISRSTAYRCEIGVYV